MSKPETLDVEYVYYTSLLKALTITISDATINRKVRHWAKKLFAPEYGSSLFKEKRNRYLCSLCICLVNNELSGVLKHLPPEGALAEIENISFEPCLPASWEISTQWLDTLESVAGLPQVFSRMPCDIHKVGPCPQIPSVTYHTFDQEFQLCLYLARPYIALMPEGEDKSKAAAWMQLLCLIDTNACPVNKSIRNEYMQALLGFASDLRLAGPFLEYPMWGHLYSLNAAAQFAAYKHPFTDPASREADEFLRSQEIPDTGAFCYVAVTGELIASSLPVKKLAKPSPAKKSKPQPEAPLTSLDLTFDLDLPLKPLHSSTPKKLSTAEPTEPREPTVPTEEAKEKPLTKSPGNSFVNSMR